MIEDVMETIQDIWIMLFPDGIWSVVLAWSRCIDSDDSDWNLGVDDLLAVSLIEEYEYTSENVIDYIPRN